MCVFLLFYWFYRLNIIDWMPRKKDKTKMVANNESDDVMSKIDSVAMHCKGASFN